MKASLTEAHYNL